MKLNCRKENELSFSSPITLASSMVADVSFVWFVTNQDILLDCHKVQVIDTADDLMPVPASNLFFKEHSLAQIFLAN